MGWVNFQVMRRTHATLMKGLGVDGKLVADQLDHSLDVNQNVYTQSPVESRLGIVNVMVKQTGAEFSDTLRGVHLVFRIRTVLDVIERKGKRE